MVVIGIANICRPFHFVLSEGSQTCFEVRSIIGSKTLVSYSFIDKLVSDDNKEILIELNREWSDGRVEQYGQLEMND